MSLHTTNVPCLSGHGNLTTVCPDNTTIGKIPEQGLDITSDKLLQMANEKQFNILIPSLVLVSIVLVVGVPGNIITIYVYQTRMRRTASRIFILAVAICDLLNCACTMPFELAIIARFWTFDSPIPCKLSRTLTYILNGSSALLLIGIAVDRYRKICCPLKPVFTPSRTKTICFVAAGVGTAASIPGFLLYGTRTYRLPVPPTKDYFVVKTCLIDDRYSTTLYPFAFMAVWMVLNISISIVLVILYFLIGKAVYRRLKLERERTYSVSKATRKQLVDMPSETSCSFDDILDGGSGGSKPKVLNNVSTPVKQTLSGVLKNKLSNNSNNGVRIFAFKRAKERTSRRIRAGRTTVMLFSVTVAYIFSFLPFQIVVIIRSIDSSLYYNLGPELKSVFNFFLRSYVVNCAINPVLYGFFNKDFRIKTGQVLRSCFGCPKSDYDVQRKPGSSNNGKPVSDS